MLSHALARYCRFVELNDILKRALASTEIPSRLETETAYALHL